MTRQLLKRHAIASAGVFLSAALATNAGAQTDVTWIAGTGDWTTGANWTGNGGFPPEGGFGEQAIINNGGVAQISAPYINDLSVLGGPGNILLGQAPGDSGTVEMTGTGEFLFEAGANINRFIDVGVGAVGAGGVGTLLMSGSSRMQMNNFFSGGDIQSLVSLSDSATIFAENDITLRATTRVVGSTVSVEATNNLTFGGAGVYIPQITGTSHSTMTAGATATLGGTLSLEFDGFTPSVGDTWDLVSASTVTGAFDAIEVASGFTLGTGQSFVVQNVSDGGGATIAQLSLNQVLALTVDRQTGAVSIENAGASALGLDAYQISSANGSLGGVWNSLDDQFAGWDEAPNSSANDLAELNPQGDLSLAGASSQSLGTPYAPTFANFGESPEQGLTFTYRDSTSGALVDGAINFVGDEIFNNMILTIDPTTGEAAISNDSPVHVVDVEAYTISSATGSLLTGNWDSLADQGETGWDDSSAANGASFLAELNPTDSTSFSDSTQFEIGQIFDTATGQQEGDIEFEFVLAGDPTVRTGTVVFGEIDSPPMIPGDFDGDGDVDVDDFGVFVNSFQLSPQGGPPFAQGDFDEDGDVDVDDFGVFVNSFQMFPPAGPPPAVAVPEPTTAAIAGMALAGLATTVRRRS